MQDQLSEILFYLKGTLKYKWVILITAWLIACSGWVFVYTLSDQYQSRAVVSVDSQTMLRPLLRGLAIQSNTAGLVHVMRQLMFTRPKLERVAQLANLDMESKNELQKLEIIAKLKKGIKIQGGRNDLFAITYNGDEPYEAQNIVHGVLTVFSEQTQQRGMNDTNNAQQFILEQIREYEMRLKNAEKARENFKRINAGFLPGAGGGQLGALNAVKKQLEIGSMALKEIEARVRVLKKQLSESLEMSHEYDWGINDTGEVNPNNPTSLEDIEIATLKANKNKLLVRYTENHPDVVGINAMIQSLESIKQSQLSMEPDGLSTSGLNEVNSAVLKNPYIQALQLSLNAAETQQAAVISRIEALQLKKDELDSGFNKRLRIETEMQNLDRDYSIIKGNYMNLIKSRETAVITAKADKSQGVLKFKIVEAPTAPVEPTGPKRILFDTIFLVVGGLVGTALAFLYYFMRPTFMSTRQLKSVTGLVVLGSVAVQEEGVIRKDRKKQILFVMLFVLLILTYFFTIANTFEGQGIKDLVMKNIPL